jgi:gas vesicle protein
MKNSNLAKILSALVVGAAAGATLGILFAPGKGSDTRSKLFKKAKDLADELNRKTRKDSGKDSEEAEDPEMDRPV